MVNLRNTPERAERMRRQIGNARVAEMRALLGANSPHIVKLSATELGYRIIFGDVEEQAVEVRPPPAPFVTFAPRRYKSNTPTRLVYRCASPAPRNLLCKKSATPEPSSRSTTPTCGMKKRKKSVRSTSVASSSAQFSVDLAIKRENFIGVVVIRSRRANTKDRVSTPAASSKGRPRIFNSPAFAKERVADSDKLWQSGETMMKVQQFGPNGTELYQNNKPLWLTQRIVSPGELHQI